MFLMHLLLNTVMVLLKRKIIQSTLVGDVRTINRENVENFVSTTTLQQLKDRIIGNYGSGDWETSIERLSDSDIAMVAHQLVKFVEECLPVAGPGVNPVRQHEDEVRSWSSLHIPRLILATVASAQRRVAYYEQIAVCTLRKQAYFEFMSQTLVWEKYAVSASIGGGRLAVLGCQQVAVEAGSQRLPNAMSVM
jgi:hypothetical protein